MDRTPAREPPFFFQKNPDSIVVSGGAFPYPAGSENVHCEIEIEVVQAVKVVVGESASEAPPRVP